MGEYLKALAAQINKDLRESLPAGAHLRTADGQLLMKMPDGNWAQALVIEEPHGEEPPHEEPDEEPEMTARQKRKAARKARREKAIPQPQGGESQDEFISRCMKGMSKTDGDMAQDQQLAICFRQYREEKTGRGEKMGQIELFKEAQQNAQYLVKLATTIEARKAADPNKLPATGDGIDDRLEGADEELDEEGIDKGEEDSGASHRMEGPLEALTPSLIDKGSD